MVLDPSPPPLHLRHIFFRMPLCEYKRGQPATTDIEIVLIQMQSTDIVVTQRHSTFLRGGADLSQRSLYLSLRERLSLYLCLSQSEREPPSLSISLSLSLSERHTLSLTACYRVAKTHRMPYLDKSFSAKEPYD